MKTGEGVQVAGEGGDEGFAFAGFHFGDLALVKDDAADELDVEVTHLDGALAGFADDGEGFREDGVEGGLFGGDSLVGVVDPFEGSGDPLAELGGLGAQGLVGECLHGGLEVVNLPDERHEALDGAFVAGAKDLSYSFVEQNRCPSGGVF
jgi:hypothetical protein